MNYKLARLDVNGLTSKGLTGGHPAQQGELEGEGNCFLNVNNMKLLLCMEPVFSYLPSQGCCRIIQYWQLKFGFWPSYHN